MPGFDVGTTSSTCPHQGQHPTLSARQGHEAQSLFVTPAQTWEGHLYCFENGGHLPMFWLTLGNASLFTAGP